MCIRNNRNAQWALGTTGTPHEHSEQSKRRMFIRNNSKYTTLYNYHKRQDINDYEHCKSPLFLVGAFAFVQHKISFACVTRTRQLLLSHAQNKISPGKSAPQNTQNSPKNVLPLPSIPFKPRDYTIPEIGAAGPKPTPQDGHPQGKTNLTANLKRCRPASARTSKTDVTQTRNAYFVQFDYIGDTLTN